MDINMYVSTPNILKEKHLTIRAFAIEHQDLKVGLDSV